MQTNEIFKHPRPAKDLSRKDYGAVRVIGYVGKDHNGNEWYLCHCRLCGGETRHRASTLRANEVASCGSPDCKRLVMRIRGVRL